MTGDYVDRLRAAVNDDEDVLAVMWELYPKLREDLRVGVAELEQLRSERDELCRQRNEWVSDMHAAFAAGLEAPRPLTGEQRWRLSQGWIADCVAERQAARDGGNAP